ncbi:MAG: hypothetical protein AABZ53_16070 [Planctomycetota bacterium]
MPALIAFAMLALVVEVQPPSTTPAPPPATTPSIGTDSFSRLNPASRKIVTDRARDFFELPNGVILDAYRLNRIRDLVAKGDWEKIDAREAAKLGLGHLDNSKNNKAPVYPSAPLESYDVSYQGLPDLLEIDQADQAKVKDWLFFVERPVVGKIDTAPAHPGQFFIELVNTSRLVATHPVNDVRVFEVLSPTEAIAVVDWIKGEKAPGGGGAVGNRVHITDTFTGNMLGTVIPGDFCLKPDGTHTYNNGTGAKATMPSYRIIRIEKPMTPEALASAIESGKIKLLRYDATVSTVAKKITHTWKAVKMALRFAPKPPDVKKPNSPA